MKSEFIDGKLNIYLEGHIDSNNAEAMGSEIAAIRSAHPDAKLLLDCTQLEYISSAGLRQILKLKKSKVDFSVINVMPDVYEVFDATGFTEMMDIRKGYRSISLDGCEVIGEGSNGIVYRMDPETIVKVYKNSDAMEEIQREYEISRRALIMGINTAIPFDLVRVGDRLASVYELLDSDSLTNLIIKDPENRDKYIDVFVDFLKEMHATEAEPGQFPSEKDLVRSWAAYLEDHLDAEHFRKLDALIDAVPADDLHLIHGDYHTNNVNYDGKEAIIIDMDTMAVGHPVFEMGSIYNAYQGFGLTDHTAVERFLKINYETATYVWKQFLKKYYGKDDVTPEENRAKIIGLTRLLRRTLRRESDNTELIERCRTELIAAIDAVDSLID